MESRDLCANRILISGSNAQLLSSELATLLSGRYVEIPVYSLGFAEHLQFSEQFDDHREEAFADFLRMGGMPATYHFERDEELIHQYINSVYNTILLKDIVKRYAIRNVPLLENIARYLFDNIGNTLSAKRIAGNDRAGIQHFAKHSGQLPEIGPEPRYPLRNRLRRHPPAQSDRVPVGA